MQSMANDSLTASYYDEVISIAERTHNRKAMLEANLQKAICFIITKPPRAEKILYETIQKARSYHDTLYEAKGLRSIGVLYNNRDSSAAEPFLNNALRLFVLINDSTGMVSVWTTLGDYFVKRGDYGKSISYQLRALEMEEKGVNRAGLSYLLMRLGEGNHYMKNYDVALDYYARAVEESRKTVREGVRALCLTNMGIIYRLKKQYRLALQYDEEALGLFKRNKDVRNAAAVFVLSAGCIRTWVNIKRLSSILRKQ
jgi:tetratricopeptide (TPR) repeat protein